MVIRSSSLLFFIMLVLLPAAVAGAGVMDLPMPSQYVEDAAGVIDVSSRQQMLGLLQELEQKTGVQMIVLTVAGLEGYPVEEVALRLAHDRWQLGQKGKDNGLLVLVATGDRAYRIEVGYGLEGILPDGVVGAIGREFFAPHFRAGDYGRGLLLAVNEMARRIAAEAKVQLTGAPDLPRLSRSPRSQDPTLVIVGFFAVVFIIVLLSRLSDRGGSQHWHRHGGGFTGGFGSFGGGSSRGGGGFGGFGGGGGGGFGGGGASGRW